MPSKRKFEYREPPLVAAVRHQGAKARAESRRRENDRQGRAERRESAYLLRPYR